MSKEVDVHYGEQEFKTVKCGIESIRSVLTGDDVHSKERLLFYLDWYMDPYYKNDLSALGEPLKELLQETVVANKDADIVDEALYLLEAYTTVHMLSWRKIRTEFLKNSRRRFCIC